MKRTTEPPPYRPTTTNTAALGRISPPIGRHFLNHEHPVDLIVKERISWTGDDFDVSWDPGTGQNPFPIFKVRVPSIWSSRRSFRTMNHQELFEMRREKYFHLHKYMRMEDENGIFCRIKSQFKCSSPHASLSPGHAKS